MKVVAHRFAAPLMFGCITAFFLQPARAGEDIRDKYGTRNTQAADAIKKGIVLSQDHKPTEALKCFDRAIALDPACDFAHYWRGISLHDLGRVEDSIKEYEKAIELGDKEESAVGVEAAFNLGLTLGMLERYEESNRWFSRILLSDPKNRVGRQGSALRNLSVNSMRQGHYLCSALQAQAAHRIDRNLVSESLIEELASKIGVEEGAQLIDLNCKPAVVRPRNVSTSLTKMDLKDAVFGRPVHLLLPLDAGKFVLAFTFQEKDYFAIQCDDSMRVERIQTPDKILAATLQTSHLYLSLGPEPRIVRSDPLTGKVERVLMKEAETAGSIAVLPDKQLLYYTSDGRLYELNMQTGVRTPIEKAATFVATVPAKNLVFALFKNRSNSQFLDFVVDGRPLTVHVDSGQEVYDPLSQYVVAGTSLILSGFRSNAGWNSASLSVSPDGEHIAVVAGGGWRPQGGRQGGYGIPVFDSDDLSRKPRYFSSDAYPAGVAINPVTNQLAAVTGSHALIYDLAKTDGPTELKGNFAGPCVWSRDGSKLLLVTKDGFQAYANALSAEETQLAKSSNRTSRPKGSQAGEKHKHPSAVLSPHFVPRENLAEVRAALSKVLAQSSTEKPPLWRSTEGAYKKWPDAAETLDALPNDAGLRIYRLRQALKMHEGSEPLELELAVCLANAGERDEAEALYLKVLRSDLGRTDLSVAAAARLAGVLRAKNRLVPALDCAVTSLRIDRGDDTARAIARDLVKSLGATDLAGRLDALIPTNAPDKVADAHLQRPSGKERKMPAPKIFASCADSVVAIEAGDSSGTGFFISNDGEVLTCAHVVPVGRRDAKVIAYSRDSKNAKVSRTYLASVVFRDDVNDVLVLRLTAASGRVKPLILTDAVPAVGTRIYSLGNPRLGARALEHSLTEGIISANDRALNGKSYLQHTAAIAPGSSGSPLLDERGLVVGLVSLKASLDETGFAIPALSIRAILKQAP